MDSETFKEIADALIKWHKSNPRPMPWSNVKDPYKIWVSEIILQQTQVKQGWDYYKRFVKKFPTVHDLAKAHEDEVMKLWEGLGYYTRATNLHRAAKILVNDYDGIFPESLKKVKALPGIGPYSAAAILSFAYNRRIPVIDTNVIRIITRLFGIEEDPTNPKIKIKIKELATKLIEEVDPASFNQGIMNFGAMQCVTRSPDCSVCPLVEDCFAYGMHRVEYIPKKRYRKERKKRFLHFIDIVDPDGNRVLNKRKTGDIWSNLYEFPSIEKDDNRVLTKKDLTLYLRDKVTIEPDWTRDKVYRGESTLTHQFVQANIYTIRTNKIISVKKPLIIVNSLVPYAFPKLLDIYLRKL